MRASDIPTKIAVPWASGAAGANIRTVPVTSSDPNAASLTLGWPPNTLTAIAAGGSPPDGRDANGVEQLVTTWIRWQSLGVFNPYDATFQTAIGGYPAGAIVADALIAGLFWRSTIDNNTNDPAAIGAPVGWASFYIPRKASTFIQKNTGSGNVTSSDRTVILWRVRMVAGGGGGGAPNLGANGATGSVTSLRDWTVNGGTGGLVTSDGGTGGTGGANGTGSLIARIPGTHGSIGAINNNVGAMGPISFSLGVPGPTTPLGSFGSGGFGEGTLDGSGTHNFTPGAGGSGEYVEFMMPVTFGTNYAFVVGAGGLCGDGSGPVRGGIGGAIFIEELY